MAKKKKKNKVFKIRKLSLALYVLSILILFPPLFVFQSSRPKILAKDAAPIINNNSVIQSVAPPIDQQWNVVTPAYDYDVVNKSSNETLEFGQKTTLHLTLKNTSNQNWENKGDNTFYLVANHPDERKSVFYKSGESGWYDENKIVLSKEVVKPGQKVDISFQITAPDKSGIYREFFTPVISGTNVLDDKNIFWDITVKDPNKKDENLNITVDGKPLKYIRVNLTEQKLYAYENGIIKYKFETSTGMVGMDTPTGEYKIWNKFPVQYSPPYQLYMDNWMAITQGGEYGIHSLPYWPLKNGGRLYEGEQHLGKKVSHGCIRLSLENSKIIYDWSDVEMPVYVEN